MVKKETLIKRMRFHEEKANHYYGIIKAMEDKERLIGFKPKNDERMSTDPVYITVTSPKQPNWD